MTTPILARLETLFSLSVDLVTSRVEVASGDER